MSGRYTFFVATGVPTAEISICTIAVSGTRYIRDTTLASIIVVKAGDSSVFTVPHVHAEDVIGNKLVIGLRQKTGSELPFLAFTIGTSSSDVAITTNEV